LTSRRSYGGPVVPSPSFFPYVQPVLISVVLFYTGVKFSGKLAPSWPKGHDFVYTSSSLLQFSRFMMLPSKL
jgi:hypothetical protein